MIQPIALWHFDETGGTMAFDSIGLVNGTLENGAAFAPGAGISGGAVSLNQATNAFVNMGNNFNLTSSFSIQAWIRMNASDLSPSMAVSKHTAGFYNGYFLAVNDVGDTATGATTKSHTYVNGGISPVSTTVVNDGLWHLLVGEFDATTNEVRNYVDGQLQGTTQANGTFNTSADFLIGGIHNLGGSGTDSGYFTGLIDEVAVYDQALTSAEVRAIYTSVPEPTASALAGVAILAGVVYRRRKTATTVTAANANMKGVPDDLNTAFNNGVVVRPAS